MSAYVGLEALKEAIGDPGRDTQDDGLLRSTINRASSLVDGYLAAIRPGYVGFAAGSNSLSAVGSNTRRYDGNNDDTLFIDDASSIASVTVDDTLIAATSYEVWPYNTDPKRALIYSLPASSVRGLLQSHWSQGTANIDVVGYWGLNYVPDDIAQVTMALAILLWRRYQSGDPMPDPEPAIGGRGEVVIDPEIKGILEALWPRWGVPVVLGA